MVIVNRLLVDDEKRAIVAAINRSGLSKNRLVWETRRQGLIYRSVLIFSPQRYYVVFENVSNKIWVKEYFPNWKSTQKLDKARNDYAVDLSSWAKSIISIEERRDAIVVSIKEGAERRRKIWQLAKRLKGK